MNLGTKIKEAGIWIHRAIFHGYRAGRGAAVIEMMLSSADSLV